MAPFSGKDLGTEPCVNLMSLSKCPSSIWRKGNRWRSPWAGSQPQEGFVPLFSEALPDLACPRPILSAEGLAQGSALCCLFQAGLCLPGCVPVAVEDLAGGGGMALSPLAWFLLSPALSPFQIC